MSDDAYICGNAECKAYDTNDVVNCGISTFTLMLGCQSAILVDA